jgi:hypothetical protein
MIAAAASARWKLTVAAILTVAACQTDRRPAATAVPTRTSLRSNVWVDYQGVLYSNRKVPGDGGFTHDIGHGAVPRFRIRALARTTARSGHRDPSAAGSSDLEIEGNFPAANGSGLLLELLRIDLPAASRGSSLAAYLLGDGPARRWGAERIRDARDVALEVDLRAESGSAAARLCRRLELVVSAPVSGDRCRLDAVVDAADGWPLVARITRTVTGPNGLNALESVTFERLSPSQASE